MLDLNRRIQYRHFNQTDIPSKELVGEIIQQAINISPVDREVFSFKIDVWGPEYKDVKHALAIEGVTHKIKDSEGVSLGSIGEYLHRGHTEDEWFAKCEEQYLVNPGGFNTQLEAPWVLALNENTTDGWYPTRSRGGDRRDLVSGNQRWKHYMNAGIFIHGLAIAANDHGVDLAYCNCFSDIRDNIMMRDQDKNNSGSENLNLVMMGLGYYDWSVAGEEGYDAHFLKTDQEGIVRRTRGGSYDTINRVRVDGYKDWKPPFEKLVTWK